MLSGLLNLTQWGRGFLDIVLNYQKLAIFHKSSNENEVKIKAFYKLKAWIGSFIAKHIFTKMFSIWAIAEYSPLLYIFLII